MSAYLQAIVRRINLVVLFIFFSAQRNFFLIPFIIFSHILPAEAVDSKAPNIIHFPSIGNGAVSLPMQNLKSRGTITTLLQKYDFSCGSAALATLLTYHYGIPTTEESVFEFMYRTGNQERIQKEGFSMLDMKRYLRQFDMEADGFNQDLEKLLEAKTPAIVLVNENGYQHFVVIKGLQGNRILLGDPAKGTRAMSREQFEAIWPSRILFVVHNRIGQAHFNLARDWQVAPRSPLAEGVDRGNLFNITLPKNGLGDF